jgi:hypothetical protein
LLTHIHLSGESQESQEREVLVTAWQSGGEEERVVDASGGSKKFFQGVHYKT